MTKSTTSHLLAILYMILALLYLILDTLMELKNLSWWPALAATLISTFFMIRSILEGRREAIMKKRIKNL